MAEQGGKGSVSPSGRPPLGMKVFSPQRKPCLYSGDGVMPERAVPVLAPVRSGGLWTRKLLLGWGFLFPW